MSIKIALAGNPNCGKTTLFNALTGSNQYVGNWPGVTVEKKEGKLKKHNDVIITDLPGIYSLSPYTLEEVVARNYLIDEKPDVVLNIIDGTNLERNLYLTTQLVELGIPVVVAINHFYADTDKEIEFIEKFCKQKGADFAVTKCFAEGGAGSIDLANKVIKACEKENNFRFLYDINMPIYEKIETIAKEIYGADGVEYTKEAKKSIDEFIKLGCDNMPVCMAKTQYSLSDNPALLGRPRGFKITVSSASLSNGAGFLVCQTGSVMTMPGLSKSPAAYKIDIDENGNTVGLF